MACFEKYVILKFKIEDKLRLCPYEIKSELEKLERGKIEEPVSAAVGNYPTKMKS